MEELLNQNEPENKAVEEGSTPESIVNDDSAVDVLALPREKRDEIIKRAREGLEPIQENESQVETQKDETQPENGKPEEKEEGVPASDEILKLKAELEKLRGVEKNSQSYIGQQSNKIGQLQKELQELKSKTKYTPEQLQELAISDLPKYTQYVAEQTLEEKKVIEALEYEKKVQAENGARQIYAHFDKDYESNLEKAFKKAEELGLDKGVVDYAREHPYEGQDTAFQISLLGLLAKRDEELEALYKKSADVEAKYKSMPQKINKAVSSVPLTNKVSSQSKGFEDLSEAEILRLPRKQRDEYVKRFYNSL